MRIQKHRTRLLLVIVMSTIILAGGVAVWLLTHRSSIPAHIRAQVSFAILLPKNYTLDSKTVSYDDTAEVLTFTLKNGSSSLTITEQATPSAIASYPEMLSRQFDMMKDKKTISTHIGTAYVATNQELHSQQMAGMNAQGTLLFAKPATPMSEDAWRKFLGSLEALK